MVKKNEDWLRAIEKFDWNIEGLIDWTLAFTDNQTNTDCDCSQLLSSVMLIVGKSWLIDSEFAANSAKCNMPLENKKTSAGSIHVSSFFSLFLKNKIKCFFFV